MSDQKYLQLTVSVSLFEFNRFKELKEKHGLSARDVLENSCCPCDKCTGIGVTVFDKKNQKQVTLPIKGILSKKKH